jgi:hypothetical protein
MLKERKYLRLINNQTERARSYLRWQNPETDFGSESTPSERTAEEVRNQQFVCWNGIDKRS